MKWQDAVAVLAKERTLALNCVKLLKKYGDTIAVDRGSLKYGTAKAEYDGIIAGLSIALIQKEKPGALSDLKERIIAGNEQREALCKEVQILLPTTTGEKGFIESVLSTAIGPLIQALQTIFSISKNEDELIRRTILTQLEATKWPEFTTIEPK